MARSDHPSVQFLRRLEHAIQVNGFAVVPVGYGGCSVPGCCGPATSQPWTYTVGLSDAGHAELVVMGLDPDGATAAINWAARAALAGQPPALDRPDLGPTGWCKVVSVPDEWILSDPNRMSAWFTYQERLGRRLHLPEVRQVVWAGEDGRFPDDTWAPSASTLVQPVLRDDPVSVPHRRATRERRVEATSGAAMAAPRLHGAAR